MAELVRASAVSKWFRSGHERITPVDALDLVLVAGEIVVITGPSGSGKTTLLQLLAGFQRPDAGTVQWPGTSDGAVPAWADVAVVPQSLGLLPELSAKENVALPLLASRSSLVGVDDEVAAALAALGVDHLADRLVGETSLGQQQRVAVARAIVGTPHVIVADEPTSHQDEAHAHVVLRALQAAADRGAGCIIAGHDDRLLDTATRVLHLESGRFTTD